MHPSRRRTPHRLPVLAGIGGCLLAALAAAPAAAQPGAPQPGVSSPGVSPPAAAQHTTAGASAVRAAAEAACPTAGRISQGYHDGHDGVDLANALGTPLYAAGSGEVTHSGTASGYGQWIRIRHPGGSVTEYGHMYERFVAVGDTVAAGQRIASMGSEGQSTGPHLHFEVHLDGGFGFGDDPVAYLHARGVPLPCTP